MLVTDGQVANEDQVLRLVADRIAGARVFTVGIDTAVNAGFLRRLAGLGGGACELVESEDRLDAVMDRIHRRIGTPVLTELRVEPLGLDVDLDSLSPSRLPDLFAGAPVVIGGRWRGRPEGAVLLRGREPSGRLWEAEVRAGAAGSRALGPVWARARLRDLEDAWAVGRGANQELEQRIVETSLRFGVLCRFTAFVAVDAVVVNEGGRVRRVVQPVDAPQGWDMFAGQAGVAAPAPMMARMGRTPGLLAATADFGAGGGRAAWQAMTPAVHQELAATGVADDLVDEAVRSAYRRRAQDLHALLGGAGTGSERAGRLAELHAGLAGLVADLESVGAATAELEPLRELLTALARTAAGPPLADDELDRLWRRALAVLEEFIQPPGARGTSAGRARSPAGPPPEDGRTGQGPARRRARDFWKHRPV